MKTGVSPWAVGSAEQLADTQEQAVYERSQGGFQWLVQPTHDSLWIIVKWPRNRNQVAFRTAYAPDALTLQHVAEQPDQVTFSLHSPLGTYTVVLAFPDSQKTLFQYTVRLTPHLPLHIPFWPRDILIWGKNGSVEKTQGQEYVRQVGLRSGLIYAGITQPKTGSFLYLQNLTALGDYCQETETSAAGTVGGTWPELGFSLPTTQDKPLPASKTFTISEALIVCSPNLPQDQFAVARDFIDHLAALYRYLPRPETKYHNYPTILAKSLHDLRHNKGCWSQHQRKPYLNAYVCDYDTPPEIMVQLAVLLPILDYAAWSGTSPGIIADLRAGLADFYDDKLGTIMRWLPTEEDKLDGSEEQKVPKVMDSWYLHHPLLNLSRMALKGDKMAKKLFLDSIEYAIKVAHHFEYQWPVFYKMDTLEVVKAETQPGEGGEKDVAGLYAHVMLQAWELTGEKRFLNEAEKAAQSLKVHGFHLFYQANNTAFSTGAMLRLYKETGKELYLNLSYVFLANLFKNVALWQCTYGYGRYFPTFFSLFPLNDAPYVAVYEEQEGFAALHDFLLHAENVPLAPSVTLLVTEFIRFAIARAVYYYPPMLPRDMLSEEVKTGEVDPELWIALEDIHDGWEKSGSVGQEVYGAGLAFGIVPRHYIQVPDADVMIFIDYPVTEITHRKNQSTSFRILGDRSLSCRMRLLKTGSKSLPSFTVKAGSTRKQQEIKPNKKMKTYWEYTLLGHQKISIQYKKM